MKVQPKDMNKLLLLDLDGTVRETISGKTFINVPEDQKLIAGVELRLEQAVLADWKIIGITNQGGVGAGHKTLESAILEQQKTMQLAPQIDFICMCPDNGYQMNVVRKDRSVEHYRSILQIYRKPAPGMLDYAIGHSKNGEILMIGDRDEDRFAALNAKVDFLNADVWHNRGLN
ncbi:HAD hydrolase-like protein [Chroococcidiopsis sp.]|uniref:HAD hydrolase-like protein n=1 Tax=Chroococcidiopsis sp. TaxID=3088168 RepID=UPI003F2F2183